jgi:broad specificity phosphatase PhoE
MSNEFPTIYMVRHGETEWSLLGKHTGLTDVPLTERGEHDANRLGERLRGMKFAGIFTSPLQRASRTCELAGFSAMAQPDSDLVEWNYGNYEGLRTAEIRAVRPQWDLFKDGCPEGETPAQVSARADRIVRRLQAIPGDALLFSSGHIIRVLAARWLRLEPQMISTYLMLSTGSLSALGYENEISRPVIRLWNAN